MRTKNLRHDQHTHTYVVTKQLKRIQQRIRYWKVYIKRSGATVMMCLRKTVRVTSLLPQTLQLQFKQNYYDANSNISLGIRGNL